MLRLVIQKSAMKKTQKPIFKEVLENPHCNDFVGMPNYAVELLAVKAKLGMYQWKTSDPCIRELPYNAWNSAEHTNKHQIDQPETLVRK